MAVRDLRDVARTGRRARSVLSSRATGRPWLGESLRADRFGTRTDSWRRARVDELDRGHRRRLLDAVRHRKAHLRADGVWRDSTRDRRDRVLLDRALVPFGTHAADGDGDARSNRSR